jgi:hypothetical protein
MHDEPSAFRFELTGDLNDDGARRPKQDWLLAHWHASEARLIANSHTLLSLFTRAAILLLMAAVAFPIDASAATLKPETVSAWEDYLHTVSSALEDRCCLESMAKSLRRYGKSVPYKT